MNIRKIVHPHTLLVVLLSVLLCAEAWFGYRISILSSRQQEIKTDYSVVNNITFGILSVDQWREKMVNVVNEKVNDFSMTTPLKKDLQEKVEKQLYHLVDQAVADMNKPQKGIGGKLKKLAFNTLVDPEEIKAEVPVFAATIVNRINKPESKKKLKSIVTSKVDQLEKQTFDNTEPASVTVSRHIYKKHGVADTEAFEKNINLQLASIQSSLYHYTYAMIGCMMLALCLWWFMRKQAGLHTTLYILSLLFAFVLLLVGITSTVIEVDARIQSLNFTLLSEKLAFTNQVLFFQSKSITGIIESLIVQPNFDAILVGILILLFVVILPVLRMMGKGIMIWGKDKYTANKLVRFLAFDLRKWDMADVMVVGIAMTYIGLNEIIKSQLSGLNIQEDLLSTVTQNNTSLQPGYYIFLAYVIYTSILSIIIKRIKLVPA
jgi:hypothetical protein